MPGQVHIFFNALVFFTRLPCPKWVLHTPVYQRQLSVYAPLIGWVVGVIASLTLIISALIFPLTVAIALSLVVSVWITGAFHEDGLADVCDGFGGAWSADQIHAIMKDSRIGAYGAVGLILVLLVKFAVLIEIGRLFSTISDSVLVLSVTLLSGHAVSRLAAISMIFTHRYVGDSSQESKSLLVATLPGQGGFVFAVCCGLAPIILFSGLGLFAVWFALAPVLITRWYLGRFFKARLSGYTGDCLGAVQQVTEVTFYLGICATIDYI